MKLPLNTLIVALCVLASPAIGQVTVEGGPSSGPQAIGEIGISGEKSTIGDATPLDGTNPTIPPMAEDSRKNSTIVGRENRTVRVATCQAKRRSIDWHLEKPAAVLAAIDKNLDELETIIHRAGQQNCDALALPEDTLGLLDWIGMNELAAKEVLPEAVKRMIDRLGRAAAKHRMYLVVCSDLVEADGKMYNTAFFLSRDGKEIGRYHKVCPTWGEGGSRERGKSFPVFDTPDLGTVGLTICYDLVFPETARCLALQGADIIFFPTMGGAAVGDDDIGLQALRVRAAENHVYLVVAFRGAGSMIISPRGKIIAKAEGADGLAIADINPFGGRAGGDSSNHQEDMRARLFRERNPAAFTLLTEPNPPILSKVPIAITSEQAGRIMARMLTVGEEEFGKAVALERAGKFSDAITAFEKLRSEYPGTWIDRVARERLATRAPLKQIVSEATVKYASDLPVVVHSGLASKHPGDEGIAENPAVLFADNFETDQLGKRWDEVNRRSASSRPAVEAENDAAIARGTRSARVQLNKEGHEDVTLVKWLRPGYDELYMRHYVRYGSDYGYHGHGGSGFMADGGKGAFKGAGIAPDGDKFFWATLEPIGPRDWNPPGAMIFYAYWWKMKPDGRGNHWGNWLQPKPDQVPLLETWTCVEWRVKTNTAGQEDGELDCWIDGRKCGEFRKINWRSVDTLRINKVQLSLWLEPQAYGRAGGGTTRTVWYDDVVVATEYIGPIKSETRHDRRP